MYPVMVSIRKDLLDTKAGLDPVGLMDILWAHSRPVDELEHIAQHVSDQSVDITLFVKSDTRENAYLAAVRILRSAIDAARPLAGWKLSTHDRANGIINIS